MSGDLILQQCSGLNAENLKMMSQASVYLPVEPSAAVELRRGMMMICAEGREAGWLAGVVVSQDGRQVLCLILGHLPEESGYQSLPARWIERVEGNAVFLSVHYGIVLALPAWHFTEASR